LTGVAAAAAVGAPAVVRAQRSGSYILAGPVAVAVEKGLVREQGLNAEFTPVRL